MEVKDGIAPPPPGPPNYTRALYICVIIGTVYIRQDDPIGGRQDPFLKKNDCVFLVFFGLTSFYLSVFTSFWYQNIALFKSFLMICFIRV